jgi:hypothetical protein
VESSSLFFRILLSILLKEGKPIIVGTEIRSTQEERRKKKKKKKKMKFTVWGRELQWRTSGRESISFPTVSIEKSK